MPVTSEKGGGVPVRTSPFVFETAHNHLRIAVAEQTSILQTVHPGSFELVEGVSAPSGSFLQVLDDPFQRERNVLGTCVLLCVRQWFPYGDQNYAQQSQGPNHYAAAGYVFPMHQNLPAISARLMVDSSLRFDKAYYVVRSL